jgi:hypothetical protein
VVLVIRFMGGVLDYGELPCIAHGQTREGDLWFVLASRTQVIATTLGDGVLGWLPLTRGNAAAILSYQAEISLSRPLTNKPL